MLKICRNLETKIETVENRNAKSWKNLETKIETFEYKAEKLTEFRN